MRFTTVAFDDPRAVVAAAHASAEPYLLLLARGARPLANAFGGLGSAAGARLGVLGGATHEGAVRRFGWMLAPANGPLPFELVPVTAPLGEPGADARVRGPIDVVAPEMVLVFRELLLEPLPSDGLAAIVELCARARAAGREVMCRPSFGCELDAGDADDRGSAAALRALAATRPELRGEHRLPAASRGAWIDREIRLSGGRRTRVRMPLPPLTILVHGAGAPLAARRARDLVPGASARSVDDPAAALRAEMRVRGDRYVLLAEASQLPDRAALDVLVEAIESAPYVALAARSAGTLDGSCALLALGRFPQHVEAAGTTLADALGSLVDAARLLHRAVRAPGFAALAAPPLARRSATIVLAAASAPEVLRMTLTALVESSRTGDELVAVCAASAVTTRKIVAAYPQLRVELDAVDPLLAEGVNRAAGTANGELVVLIADDVLLTSGALDRVREAFGRIPALGAAFPVVPGAPGGEGVTDVQYADLAQMRALAEQRALERSGDSEPIDVAVSPVIAVAREALSAVGGIDPAHGPTRRGIADLVARLRAAGYGVVRCDDALAHRFDAAASHHPAAAADLQQPGPVVAAAEFARGFDPARRVPFVRAAAGARSAHVSHAIALAVGGAGELDRAAEFLAAAARTFDVRSPVHVYVLLDGTVTAAETAARIRSVLAASGKPLDETLGVRIERVADIAAWRAALEPGVRLAVAAGHEREPLRDLAAVTARSLGALLEPAAR